MYLFERVEVELKGRDLLPIRNLQNLEHVSDVERELFEISIVAQNLADSGHLEDKLVLEGLEAELGHLDFIFNHHLEVVEVLVGLPKLGERLESA